MTVRPEAVEPCDHLGAVPVRFGVRLYRQAGAHAHTVAVRASHAVSVFRPDTVADIIEKAARTVRG